MFVAKSLSFHQYLIIFKCLSKIKEYYFNFQRKHKKISKLLEKLGKNKEIKELIVWIINFPNCILIIQQNIFCETVEFYIGFFLELMQILSPYDFMREHRGA